MPYHPLCAHLAVVQKESDPCAIFLPQTPAAHSPTLSSSTSARRRLTAKGSPFASSMFRDVQRRRAIEVEEIIGGLVRRGLKAKIGTVLLSAAYAHLLVYQRKVVAAG
jgi:ketopantoate reductase